MLSRQRSHDRSDHARPAAPIGRSLMTMHYNPLGSTGLFVSELCLGTMTFGGKGFWTAIGTLDQSVADRIVARALDAGVNLVDTADIYSDGLSEEITGRALRASGRNRSDYLLATKALGQV